MTKIRADRRWYKGHGDKEQRNNSLSAGLHLFEDYTEMLKELVEDQRDSLEGTNRFDIPNWENHTAYALGKIQGLKDASALLPRKQD